MVHLNSKLLLLTFGLNTSGEALLNVAVKVVEESW